MPMWKYQKGKKILLAIGSLGWVMGATLRINALLLQPEEWVKSGCPRPRMGGIPCHANRACFFLKRPITCTAASHAASTYSTTRQKRTVLSRLFDALHSFIT